MAGVSIPLADLPALLRAKAERVRNADLAKPLKTIRLLLVSATKENFAGSHDPDGVPWEPLHWRKGQPLRDTGILMASVTAGGIGSIDQLWSTGLSFGTSLDYAGIHQFGGTISQPERSRGKGEKPWVFQGRDGSTVFTRRIRARTISIPQRRFLGVSSTLRAKIDGVVERFFKSLLGDQQTP